MSRLVFRKIIAKDGSQHHHLVLLTLFIVGLCRRLARGIPSRLQVGKATVFIAFYSSGWFLLTSRCLPRHGDLAALISALGLCFFFKGLRNGDPKVEDTAKKKEKKLAAGFH
jgi:hypothetical protein